MATGFSVTDALNKQSKAGIDESPRARFRTKDISIFKIYSNSMNFYPQEGIEEKASEILMVGLLENLAVKYEPCEKGEYKLISGERRWRALQLLVEKGYKEFEIVTCQVRSPINEHEERIEIIIANSSRPKNVATKIQEEQILKEELKYMKENHLTIKGYDLQNGRLRDVIADMLKVSATKIAQIESIHKNLIPEWKEELDKERITFSAAYELSGMPEDKQKAALQEQEESGGGLTHKDIKKMKSAEVQQSEPKAVSQSDTDIQQDDPEQPLPGQMEIVGIDMNMKEYQTPHPEGITSICYSCTEYETCNVKTSTCTSCDQYKNRKEAYKTEGQKYEEEQAAIDRDTKKKLRDMADAQQMEQLPSDVQQSQKIHQIKLARMYFDAVVSGKKPFELRKNDRGYKVGDILELMEYADGKNTGRMIQAKVTFMLEDYTGLEDGYCILGIQIMKGEKNE